MLRFRAADMLPHWLFAPQWNDLSADCLNWIILQERTQARDEPITDFNRLSQGVGESPDIVRADLNPRLQ